MAASGEQNAGTANDKLSRHGWWFHFTRRPFVAIGMITGIVCAAVFAGSAFRGTPAPVQKADSSSRSHLVTEEVSQPARSRSVWASRQVAGLHMLAPSDFRVSNPATLSPRQPEYAQLEAQLFESSEAFEAIGGGFYIVVVHTIARRELPLKRDLERAAWDSVEKLNPVLIAPNAEKGVRTSKIAGVSGFRASCPIINRGNPALFESATFERDRDDWLVSIIVTEPTDDDLKQIEHVFESIEMTTPR